ncbi:Protein of unknown function, partial [Gryllus bimaculatus]
NAVPLGTSLPGTSAGNFILHSRLGKRKSSEALSDVPAQKQTRDSSRSSVRESRRNILIEAGHPNAVITPVKGKLLSVAVKLKYRLFGQTEVTPTIEMGVIEPCTQAAFQIENDSCAVEHAVSASAADAYASLVEDLFHPCEVSPQVFMDVSHDPCTSEQVQEAILGDESATSIAGSKNTAISMVP